MQLNSGRNVLQLKQLTFFLAAYFLLNIYVKLKFVISKLSADLLETLLGDLRRRRLVFGNYCLTGRNLTFFMRS
jgi:hypothetical protein